MTLDKQFEEAPEACEMMEYPKEWQGHVEVRQAFDVMIASGRMLDDDAASDS